MAAAKEAQEEHETTTKNMDDANHDPQFEHIVSLPEQEIKTLEEDEDELFKMRAKLFRFASENDLPQWKERGTGDVKLLKHKEKGTIRLLMRRDKTLKICANHYITPLMELKPNAGSDRAWVWNTHADFADESRKPELLAIRFLNAENAQKFKTKFEECRHELEQREKKEMDQERSYGQMAKKLEELSVKDGGRESKQEIQVEKVLEAQESQEAQEIQEAQEQEIQEIQEKQESKAQEIQEEQETEAQEIQEIQETQDQNTEQQ